METLALDKASFLLGMVTAFCECVAADCKPLALSPPMTDAEYNALHAQAEALIAAHGLKAFHEMNLDLPPEERCHWLIVYARDEALDAYRDLRARGENPRRGLAPFARVLGYGARRVDAGYDAVHALFPSDASDDPGKAFKPCTK